jgi:hypothetical protein
MEFKIRDDILIRARSIRTNKIENYNSNDFAKAMAFFLDKINAIKDQGDKNIGLMFGNLTLLSMALMFAIIKSKRDYTVFMYTGDDISHSNIECTKVFLTGAFKENADTILVEKYPDYYIKTESLEFEDSALNYHRQEDLNIVFGENTKTYSFIRDIDIERRLNFTTGKIEASSIQAAMDNYYDENDYCVFVRPLKHIGVATLAIYPAFFKARVISLCNYKEDWDEEYMQANHTHVSQVMMTEKWPMPSKLRMLTTGGYPFTSDYANQIKSMSEVEAIIDCYGTSTCPPPLAIRSLIDHIRAGNSTGIIPFKWINNYIKFINRDDVLYFTTADADTFKGVINEVNGEICTGDRIDNFGDSFILHGSAKDDYIRVKHLLWRVERFESFFKDKTGIDSKVAFYKQEKYKIPVLLVEQDQLEVVKNFVKKHDVEVSIYIKND